MGAARMSTSFPPPELRGVAELLQGAPFPWFVAGGWALDLFLGHQTRPHEDVEVALFRRDQHALRDHLAGWAFQIADPRRPGRLHPWRARRWLELPIHEIHASRTDGSPAHLEILLNEREGERWVYRRNPTVTCPLSRVGVLDPGGLPALAPEIVLLYKAKSPRDRDVTDFEAAHGALSPEGRAWLRRAVERTHPDSPWLPRL